MRDLNYSLNSEEPCMPWLVFFMLIRYKPKMVPGKIDRIANPGSTNVPVL